MPQCLALCLVALHFGCLIPQDATQAEPQGFLGVKLENHHITDDYVLVRITEVIAKGPAERAGLKAGDVILSVANVDAKNKEILIDTIKSFKPGDRITIVVSREEKELSFSAVLVKREEP